MMASSHFEPQSSPFEGSYTPSGPPEVSAVSEKVDF
jgi:hypothetical protein